MRSIALTALLGLAACTSTGDYQITWSFIGAGGSTFDCSQRGVERVRVRFYDPTGATLKGSHVFACGRGGTSTQNIAVGTYLVEVQALRSSGRPFLDPITGDETMIHLFADVVIASGDRADLTVEFTPNPECADGVDNDLDGLVDHADSGCRDASDLYDPGEDEADNPRPGQLGVTWAIGGGLDQCGEVQPSGADLVRLLIDGAPAGTFDCTALQGTTGIDPGEHSVRLELLDGAQTLIAQTADATVLAVAGLPASADFDFDPGTFQPPQVGELRVDLSWETPGGNCSDASPLVASQSLLLVDAGGVTVDASTLRGGSVDGTAASIEQCVEPGTGQGILQSLPVGRYTLTVRGIDSASDVCWMGVFPDLPVGIGSNAAHALTIARDAAPGTCP